MKHMKNMFTYHRKRRKQGSEDNAIRGYEPLGYRMNQARNFYFYQSLTTFNKLEIMSDVGPG